MMKFRLPRKEKKKLKKGIYMYPQTDSGSIVADITSSQEDYTNYKKGIVRKWEFLARSKAEIKEAKIKWELKFLTPITIDDNEIEVAVNTLLAQEYRDQMIRLLLRAKKHPIAIKSYYIFVNAWIMTKKGQDESLTACMVLDSIISELNS